jgi:antitoxin MazE
MKTVVQKWGNSLALRIPKTMAEHIKIKEGTAVEVVEDSNGLLIKPQGTKASLKELLAKVKPKNIHGETRTDPPTGREIW